MCQIARFLEFLATLFPILINAVTDSLRFLQSLTARRTVLAAENLFLRKQFSLLSRTSDSASPADRRSSFQLAILVALLRLEERSVIANQKP
jgi:hypothetical protein